MPRIIAELRELTHQVEQISEAIAKKYDLQHLSGPQGHVLVFCIAIKTEIFLSRTLKKSFKSQSRLRVIW